MSGELGVDLEGFYNRIEDWREIGVPIDSFIHMRDSSIFNRNLSRHYLALFMNGPVYNDNFANYILRSKIYGFFENAKIIEPVNNLNNKTSNYFNPNIRSIYGKLTFFPNRKYPIEIFHSESDEPSLRYEQNNRSDTLGISVLDRRYDTKRSSDGGSVQYSYNDHLNINGSTIKEESKITRLYDFNEDRFLSFDDFDKTSSDSTTAQNTITIVNSLTDSRLEIIFDNLFTYLVDTNNSLTIVVDSGKHYVKISTDSPRYDNLEFYNYPIYYDMIWRINYFDQPTPNDIDQKRNNMNVAVNFDNNNNFKNNTIFDYSDTKEAFQRQSTYLTNVVNNALYTFSKNLNVSTQSNLTTNQSDIIIEPRPSHQRTFGFFHSTVFNYESNNGITSLLTHSYNYNRSINGRSPDTTFDGSGQVTSIANPDTTTSKTNIITNQVTIPNEKFYGHVAAFRTSANILSDNSGYKNNQYSMDVINKFSKRFGRIIVNPKNLTKYSITNQQTRKLLIDNSSLDTTFSSNKGTSKELESRFFVGADMTDNKILGDLRTSLEYGYRKKFDEKGDDVKNRYMVNLNIIKKFGRKYKASFLTTQEKEVYDVYTLIDQIKTHDKSRKDIKESYKFDAMIAPWNDFIFSAGYMIIYQTSKDIITSDSMKINESTIKKITFSIDFKLPLLKLPVKSFYSKDIRELSQTHFDTPSGTTFDVNSFPRYSTETSLTTKISYQFRKIALIFTHEYKKEFQGDNKLIPFDDKTYSFHEITGKITRRFNIF